MAQEVVKQSESQQRKVDVAGMLPPKSAPPTSVMDKLNYVNQNIRKRINFTYQYANEKLEKTAKEDHVWFLQEASRLSSTFMGATNLMAKNACQFVPPKLEQEEAKRIGDPSMFDKQYEHLRETKERSESYVKPVIAKLISVKEATNAVAEKYFVIKQDSDDKRSRLKKRDFLDEVDPRTIKASNTLQIAMIK